MADSLQPAQNEAENVPIINQPENSVRKLRRPKKPSQEKKRKLKSTKKRYNKILGSWTEKTHAYVKIVSGGMMAPWSLAERKALLEALKTHSHQDWDALCKVLPERSKEEIQRFIEYLRGCEVSKQKCTAEAQLTWLPIESWLDMCQEMVHYEQSDLSTLISRVFSIIGNFSKFPEVTNPSEQPDYAKIYRYIAAVLDDSLSLPELSPLEAAIMVDLTHGLGDQLRMSDTTLQRKVMCWKYKMLNRKFDFLDIKGSVEHIRKALTNDFSDMQKQSHHPTEVVSPTHAATSQSGDSDTNTSKTLETSSSQQTGNETPAEPRIKRRGRPPKDMSSDPFKYLEKPRLYSMNPFCVPIRLLKLKPLLAENGGLGRFSIHRQDSSSSVTNASMPETRMTEVTNSRTLDKDQGEGVQITATKDAEQDTIRELAGVCLEKVPSKPRRSVEATPRPPEASTVGKKAVRKSGDTGKTVLARKVGSKVFSGLGAQATAICETVEGADTSRSGAQAMATCETVEGMDTSRSGVQAMVTCETVEGKDTSRSGTQASVTCEASPGTSRVAEPQRAAPPSVSMTDPAKAPEGTDAGEKQPEPLKVVRAFRCVRSQDGQMLLVPIKLPDSGVLPPADSQNLSQQLAKPLQIAACPKPPLQSAVHPVKPLQSAVRLTKSLQSAASSIGSRKFQSGLTVSSSLFRSPLRAPIIGCSVSCGPDESSEELQMLKRPYRQPIAKRKLPPVDDLSEPAKQLRRESQERSRTLQDLPSTSAPQSTERGTDSEQEILAIKEMCKADRLKAKLLAAVYADKSPSKKRRHQKLDQDKTKPKRTKVPKALLTQFPKRRRGRPPGSGKKQKLAESGKKQSNIRKKLGRPTVKDSSTSGTFKQRKSTKRTAAMSTNTAAVRTDSSVDAVAVQQFSTAEAEATSSVQVNNPVTKSQLGPQSGSGTPVIQEKKSETSKVLATPVSSNTQIMSSNKTAAGKTDGLVQAQVVQPAPAGSQILPLPLQVSSKTGLLPENGARQALKRTGEAFSALGQKASLNSPGTASTVLGQKTSMSSTGTASSAQGQKASTNSTEAVSPAMRQKTSSNSPGIASSALGQKASGNSTGAVSPAMGQKASMNSSGTASPALGQKASMKSTGTASPALGQKAAMNSTGAVSPAMGQKASMKSTGTASPALGQKASLNSSGAVSPAMGQKASLNSSGAVSPAMGQKAAMNSTGTASPALGQIASRNSTGAASPAMGQKASLNSSEAVSPAIGQTASFSSTGTASPALGQKALMNSNGTASPALGQKASFKAILAQVASPHNASRWLATDKTPSCSSATKDLENCTFYSPVAGVSGTHASPSSRFSLSEQLSVSKVSLPKKRKKAQNKSDCADKYIVPAAGGSGTQVLPPSSSAPSGHLPTTKSQLLKKIKSKQEKSNFARRYTGAKPKVVKTSKPRPIDSVDLNKADVVYVSLDEARQRAFNTVQNGLERPGSSPYKVNSEIISLVSI